MWPGPYGEWGSRKYLLTSLNASLKRLQTDYVDIFYSHRFDPNTPLEETMGALDTAVRSSGKALYTAISNYSAEQTRRAIAICEANGFVKPILHQPSYSLLNRWIEPDLLNACGELGVGVIAFCPLAQGLLTDKYLRRNPRRLPRQAAVGLPEGRRRDGGAGDEIAEARRHREGPGPDAGAAFPELGASRRPRDQRPDRREPCVTDRRERQGGGEIRVH